MKKFLSLVLTLALTLSLVVLPANAGTDTISLKVDEQKTQTMTTPTEFTPAGSEAVTISEKVTAGYTATYAYAWGLDASADSTYLQLTDTNKQTVKLTGRAAKENVGINCTCTVTLTKDGADTITGTATQDYSVKVTDSYTLTVNKTNPQLYFNGETTSVTLSYTLKKNGDTVPTTGYTVELSEDSDKITTDNAAKTITMVNGVNAEKKNISVTATAKVNNETVATATIKVDIVDRYEAKLATGADEVTVVIGNSKTLTAPTLYDNDKSETVSGISSANIDYTITENTDAKISMTGHTVKALKAGTAKVRASISYGSNNYPIEYTITAEKAKLTLKLDEVVNGEKGTSWDNYDLEEAILVALDDALETYDGNESITVSYLHFNNTGAKGGKLFDKDDHELTNSVNLMEDSDLYFDATAGYLGDAEFKGEVKVDNEIYECTLTIPVEADETIDATASAEEGSSSTVSFTLPDDYDYWYIYEGSNFKTELYESYKTGSWSSKIEEGKTYSRLKVSDFDDGDVTLYVVGLDSHGVASTGKLVVSLDAYDIEYSGAAGETITFDQDDFDDLLDEVADDRNQDGSKAKVEFTNVTFTIPTEKTQGILYNGSSKITSKSTKCTDLDRVTFAIADKAKKEVVIKFTMNYDYYSDSSKTSTKKSQSVNGRVVVSVVNEDIKYSVPVGGNVVFDASDFEDFFTDTYKNGTLSYVTFDKYTGTNGILYALYSTIGYGTTAKTNDKFYYDSSKAADLDLDDVTFVSSTFAKAGEKIYLPFTAYGTKSSQKVEGCVAITLTAARTMNFTDVTTADWFYNNVKNAYTMGLIEGKNSTTTFKPQDNMTWAEAVTLAARMNELYYTGKVTLSNSTSGNWYSSYESYAISKGIISTYLGTKANTNISRKDYVDIFYNALPASAYTARNSITKIPDLTNDATNAKIYTFYKAGILTGYANTPGKTNGAFGPNDNIKRSEVATILIRMMDASTRMYFTL